MPADSGMLKTIAVEIRLKIAAGISWILPNTPGTELNMLIRKVWIIAAKSIIPMPLDRNSETPPPKMRTAKETAMVTSIRPRIDPIVKDGRSWEVFNLLNILIIREGSLPSFGCMTIVSRLHTH
jgi:hypothetical protein